MDISIVRACRVMDIYRSGFYYAAKRNDDEVVDSIRERCEGNNDGFWKIYCRLRNDGYAWNHKKVYRVYKYLNLTHRRRLKKRLSARVKEPLLVPEGANKMWSMDFVSDVLTTGRRFRVLNVIDDFNREAVAMEVGTSLPSCKVLNILEQATWRVGKPERIRVDNGPDLYLPSP